MGGEAPAYHRWAPDAEVARVWRWGLGADLDGMRAMAMREGLGAWSPLMSDEVKPSTQRQYLSAVGLLAEWLEDECGVHELPRTPELMDDALIGFAWHLYTTREGRGRGIFEQAIAGVEWLFPRWEKLMRGARASNKGWKRRVPSDPHAPLTWGLTVSLAVDMCRVGEAGCAMATLLAFDCYLRISEVCGLRINDVSPLADVVPGRSGVLVSLRWCKTGANQSVIVRDPKVAKYLRMWVRKRRREASAVEWVDEPSRGPLLFPPARRYRTVFDASCRNLGYTEKPLKFTPHSLRHGGATRDFLDKVPMEDILARGRWVSCMSARHYIQIGPALAASAKSQLSQWRKDANVHFANHISTWLRF